MQKGFSIPLLLIIALLLSLPLIYFAFSDDFRSFNPLSDDDSVKGVASVSPREARPGFSVTITSESGWDLVKYLCVSTEECTQSAISGKKWGTVSGGEAESQTVVINALPGWEEYQHIKYYIKPSWTSVQRDFTVVELGGLPGSVKQILADGEDEYEVVIIPVSEVLTEFKQSATFTDR
jgi:hypothetical protein